jgi:hypothetical protein
VQRTGIAPEELAARRERLLEHAGARVVLFGQVNIQYYTGFNFLSNERPVVVVVGGELTAFVPRFEVERTEQEGYFDRVESYPEYPGPEHPMRILERLLDGPLAADQDGYPGQIGRRSAWAHAVAHNIRFEPGDMLVSETAAPVWGYNAEEDTQRSTSPRSPASARQRPVGRAPPLRPQPQRLEMARLDARRSSAAGDPQQGHLPRQLEALGHRVTREQPVAV